MADNLHILFVCTANQQRSPTAEALFNKSEHYEARSCGVHTLSAVPCEPELIQWADMIFCMENQHREALLNECPAAQEKQILVLDIPDIYLRNDPGLIMELRQRLGEYLEHPPG